MSEHSDEIKRLANLVIEPPAPYENEIEAAIKALLRGIGFQARTQAIPGGEADIFLPNNNLVIETKDRDKVDPDGPGSLPGETQRQQLERYVVALHAERRQELPMTPNKHWRGILTDGMQWYFYEWNETDEGILALVKTDEERPPTYEPEMLLGWLPGFVSQVQLKRTLPDDLYGIFGPSLFELRDVYQELADAQGTVTKFALWQDMMAGSGFEVGGSAEELFVNHTFFGNDR